MALPRIVRSFLQRQSQVKFASSNLCSQRYASLKAAILQEPKEALVVEEIKSRKKLKKGEVRIGVHCSAVNAPDRLLTQGLSEDKVKLPFIPGFEVAGEILERHDKSNNEDEDDDDVLEVGDRVLALSKEDFGGFSEECIVSEKDVWKIPSELTYETAAALGDSYATALIALGRRAQVKAGNVVLITAQTGGLGLAAVDVAANVYKGKVISISDTEDEATLVRDKGAWSAITYNPKTLLKSVQEVSENKGADIVLDTCGGAIFKDAVKCVALEGKVLMAGFASQKLSDVPLSSLLELPSFSLIGVSLSNYRQTGFKIYRRVVQDVIDMCEQGLITPSISKVYQLEEVNEALQFLDDKKCVGKVILKIQD
ncbi:unnamed protein product [Bemisia tabaci]|uniref:Enoyl reductase (ER) domain-containing protein n=1 Tax=Bemisia tabaci TaxID=7038 RepID=A0A9P0F0H8_BEMTA|nr:PREDICTED: quinone oxidoreductase-like protein 2 [Bemisia tabaci]CAH0384540.1 unnamed protein product [Bemisia tabaci]